MRRKEKQIAEKSDIESVIRNAIVCRIALSDNNLPYIVPVCFGYQENTIYIHGALEGRKIEILRKNNHVCFEFDIDTEIIEGKSACDWGVKYRSVIGFGKAFFLEDPEDKRKALGIIMNQYSNQSFHFPDKSLSKTAVIKIEIESMTGKESGM